MNHTIDTFADFKRRYPIRPADPATWLGNGSYGRVVKVEDQVETEWVAVKISEYKGEDAQSLRAEVELARRIPRHTNIARYDSCYRFETDASVSDFAVMKYYPDGNLAKLLKRESLTAQQVYDLTKGILLGLQHLHRHRVVHRDFKPANILISRDNGGRLVPKIADFGLSKWIDGDTSADRSDFDLSDGRGTPSYKAPEQIEGGRVSYNLDLWAFGVILYEMLLGEKPFAVDQENDSEQLRRRTVERKIVEARLPAQVDQIVEPYRTLVCRCLVRDLHQRVRRADELLDLLERSFVTGSGQPVVATCAAPTSGEEQTDLYTEEKTDVFSQTDLTDLLTEVAPEPTQPLPAQPRLGRADAPAEPLSAPRGNVAKRRANRLWPVLILIVAAVGGLGLYLNRGPAATDTSQKPGGSASDPVNVLTTIASSTSASMPPKVVSNEAVDQLLQQTRTAFYRAQYPQALLLAEKGLNQAPQRPEFGRLKSLVMARLSKPVAPPETKAKAPAESPAPSGEAVSGGAQPAAQLAQQQYDQFIEQGNNAIDHGNKKTEAITAYNEARQLAETVKLNTERGHDRYLFYLKKGDRIFDRDGQEGALWWYRVAQAIENTGEINAKIKKCAQLQ